MTSIIKNIAGYFFTYTCPGCDSFDYDVSEPLCTECMEQIRFINPPYCSGCGAELDGVLDVCSECIHCDQRPWNNVLSVFRMQGLGGQLIHRFKYNGVFELGRTLGTLAARAVVERGMHCDVLVPIPLHWERRFIRGYNQSEIIAEQLGLQLGKPVERLLKRTRYTKQQAKLGKCEREKNLMGAFSAIKGANCEKRSILVVDDVMTTGATLEEAVKELLNRGAAEVNVLVLARR